MLTNTILEPQDKGGYERVANARLYAARIFFLEPSNSTLLTNNSFKRLLSVELPKALFALAFMEMISYF